jgi:hypothetical protein
VPLPLSQRERRLVFAKTGGDPLAIERSWRSIWPSMLADCLLEAVEAAWGLSICDVPRTIQESAVRRGVFFGDRSELMMRMIREVDNFTRVRRANLVARALLPYPVDIFGDNWGHLDHSGARAAFHGPADFPSLLRCLPRYLGSISTHPMVEESVHDRVFHALSAGVVPVSNANTFSNHYMPALGRYAFRFTPESVTAAVEAVLADPATGIDLTEATYATLLPEFSMRQSLRQIELLCSLVPFNAPV